MTRYVILLKNLFQEEKETTLRQVYDFKRRLLKFDTLEFV